MRRTVRLVIALCALAAFTAPAAMAAERMWVGFHDDPSFRWVPDRAGRIQSASREGATIMRLLVQWNLAAPQRPSNPADPFDPAYIFDDVDEALRTAQETDMEVMLTISGTPRWANGDKNPNIMPRRLRRTSPRSRGRYRPGTRAASTATPSCASGGSGTSPTCSISLTPQFNAAGKSVAPANYAKLYAAGYTGIKAGNWIAKIGIGETSARGSDRATGLRPIHSPGRFAELVAKANPRLKFDAWSHHPYPFNPNSKPSQIVKWPNVSLASLPRFNAELKKWFNRKNVPIWVTEYGHQTRPEDRFGVPYATQAAYIQQSMAIAKRFPFVEMFIWFVYQDDQGQPWESGLYRAGGAPKGSSPSKFGASARPLDARNGVYAFRAGTLTPLVNAVHQAVLRRGHHGRIDRDDVAHLPCRTADRRRPADVPAPARLHDQRAPALQAADGQRGDVHCDVRAERPARRQSQPQADASRDLVRKTGIRSRGFRSRNPEGVRFAPAALVFPSIPARRGPVFPPTTGESRAPCPRS